jgi:hypothetical protein
MSAPRHIRLIALWRDDPTEARMTVDLRVDEARIVSPWDVFGAFDLDGGACRPFILRRDGAIYFGAAADARWRSNLRGAEIKISVRFKVWWNDEDYGDYEIVKLSTLGAKETGAKDATS